MSDDAAAAELQASIRVEVAYADAALQLLRVVELPKGSTAGQAIEASKILDAVPSDFRVAKIGVFGRIAAAETVLQDGDRVELYRPLTLDPKEARRRRAGARKP